MWWSVTMDEVWIDDSNYCTLYTQLVTPLYKSLSHRLVFSVTIFTAPLGNIFRQRTFLCFRAHVLAGWRPSHTDVLLFWLPFQETLLRTAGPLYIPSVRPAQKTLLPTSLVLLHVTQPLHINGYLCWLHNSNFQLMCHIAPSLRLPFSSSSRRTAISFFRSHFWHQSSRDGVWL
jgi:hypothetical protein